ncbi:MAG: putative O-glycosylation ligase, exosortase A system-associated, partial [Gammaproteobacteria bacterium]|nr:putative O-glycosylation ligase, exosortase A system-associated [Gammaproteobacteria bacterium]
MRSLLLLFVIMIVTPSALVLPHLGVLLWTWISIMNPHRLSWGFADNLPFVLIIASITITTWLFSREPKLPPSRVLMWAAFAFTIQATISSVAALHPEHSWPLWESVIKTFVLFFVAAALINSKVRIQAMLWIIGISFGFFATNGVMATLSSGGMNVLRGPPRTMLYDNNALALSLVMALPVLNYLRMSSANQLVRTVLVVVMMFTLVAILTSYSRGSLIALAAGGLLFLRSAKGGVIVLIMLVALGLMVVQVMPERWHERVFTITSVESIQADSSFSGRTDAWYVSWRMAKDRPLTGGGFSAVEHLGTFIKYRPDATRGRAAHSVYFQVLGDHGFIGLGLYLAMLA